MKESITKFDLEAAFKALDEIDVPKVAKVKANRPALTEIFSRKSKFDALMEEYYDINDMTELDDAKEAREAEVAQAKLARIEKIVDLDAESPEDLLPSYVGKFIMQCPQCMTLFYKNPEDIEASEEDPDIVNVNEICQHCGNEAGYTLIGKVGEATQEEAADFNQEETVDVDSTEDGEDVADELPAEDEEALDIDLDAELDELDLDLDLEDEMPEDEEEKKEESFTTGTGEQVLTEELVEAAEPEVSADDFEKLISSPEFKKPISDSDARAMMDEIEGDNKDNVKESVEINNETLKYVVINPDGTYAGVPCTSEEEARDLAAQKEGRIIVTLGTLVEGIFDSKEKKQKLYAEAVKQIFGKDINVVANEAVINASNLIQEVAEKLDVADAGTSKNIAKGIINQINSVKNTTNKLPLGLVKKVRDLGQKYESDSINLEELREFITKVGKMQSTGKTGYGAYELLLDKVNKSLITKLDHTVKFLKKEFGITESCDVSKESEPLEEDVFDKLKDMLKSRDAKASWLLANTAKDYSNVAVDDDKLIIDENNKKFDTFAIFGYTSRNNKGELIKEAPNFNDESLVLGKDGVQYSNNFKEAEKTAKTWSEKAGNGPAFIYMTKGENDEDAAFICEYFMGSLQNDQLDKYFNAVKADHKNANITNESIDTILDGIEELHEGAIEKLISDSLVESYGNVAGFRLTECGYEDKKLTIDGTIFFTSGNRRKTTYSFTEALINKDGKISMHGINEKLGLDKQFTITGYTNKKTFITESFSTIKK